MTDRSSLPRYCLTSKNTRQRLPAISTMGLMFVGAVLCSSMFQNDTVRLVMLCIALTYPPIILFLFLTAVPKINYVQLGPEGICLTAIGFIRKTIPWADIQSIDSATIDGQDMLGVVRKSPINFFAWGRQFRRKSLGWDELVPNGYLADGTPLAKDAVKQFKRYSDEQ